MELRDIEYFAVIAEQGHLGRAAEALRLSTPALSKSLRRLEQSVGTKLVKRTPKGVELTAAGTALFARVGQLRLALGDVAHEVEDISQGRVGVLRIGANQFSIDFLLPAACCVLMEDAPKATVKLTAGGSDVLMPALHSGRLDLIIGFFASVPEGIAHEHLMTDEFVVYARADHPLAKFKQVTVDDLASNRWALGPANVPDWQWVHRVFEESGLAPPQIAMETSATRLRLEAVAASELLGFAPRQFVLQATDRLRLAELRVEGLAWPCNLGVRYRKDAYLSPAARRFIEILKATAKEIAKEQ